MGVPQSVCLPVDHGGRSRALFPFCAKFPAGADTMNRGNNRKIGLALSGGGSRAIAFHLGCLRALNDLGILQKTRVMSIVSGGSVIGALYAYGQYTSFEAFDAHVVSLLKRGLQWRIVRMALLSAQLPK